MQAIATSKPTDNQTRPSAREISRYGAAQKARFCNQAEVERSSLAPSEGSVRIGKQVAPVRRLYSEEID
jgi:hypothetical protein